MYLSFLVEMFYKLLERNILFFIHSFKYSPLLLICFEQMHNEFKKNIIWAKNDENCGTVFVLVNLMEKEEKQKSNHVFFNVSFSLCLCLLPGCLLAKRSSITMYVALTKEDFLAHGIFLT